MASFRNAPTPMTLEVHPESLDIGYVNEIGEISDVIALALAQLVRDRWAAEMRGIDEGRGSLRVLAREATIHPTDAAVAYGFAAAIPDRLDVTVGYGRGERI
jgi:hypothetical protein